MTLTARCAMKKKENLAWAEEMYSFNGVPVMHQRRLLQDRTSDLSCDHVDFNRSCWPPMLPPW